jgi:hypothetical protein
MQVAHAYNPNYSEDGYQEDCGSKPAWANCLWEWDPVLKKLSQKMTDAVA